MRVSFARNDFAHVLIDFLVVEFRRSQHTIVNSDGTSQAFDHYSKWSTLCRLDRQTWSSTTLRRRCQTRREAGEQRIKQQDHPGFHPVSTCWAENVTSSPCTNSLPNSDFYYAWKRSVVKTVHNSGRLRRQLGNYKPGCSAERDALIVPWRSAVGRRLQLISGVRR